MTWWEGDALLARIAGIAGEILILDADVVLWNRGLGAAVGVYTSIIAATLGRGEK